MPKVGILIPTMNRSDFLIRQLEYYSLINSNHPVYIGDASNIKHRTKIETAIIRLSSHIDIKYFYWPKCDPHLTLKKLGEKNKESYCAFTGDDDFFVPDSLTKCAEFLDNNPLYRTAQGKGVLFSLDRPGAFGSLTSFDSYWKRQEAEEDSASSRMLNFAGNYWVPQFSVHRSNEFIKDSLNYGKKMDKSFGELLHSFTFIVKGKSKFIDCLYLVRQGHNNQYSLPDTFDWISNLEWQPSCELFMKYLTKEIVDIDGLSSEKNNCPFFVKARIYIKAKGSMNSVSMNKPTIALTSIFFLITPYNVNEVAKEIEIQGSLPALNVRISTPIAAIKIAII